MPPTSAHMREGLPGHEERTRQERRGKHQREEGRLERPQRCSVLQWGYRFLMEELDPALPVEQLYSRGAITRHELEAIQEPLSRAARIEALIAVLNRNSDSTYEVFKRCLRDTNQAHVANELDKMSRSGSIRWSQPSSIRSHANGGK